MLFKFFFPKRLKSFVGQKALRYRFSKFNSKPKLYLSFIVDLKADVNNKAYYWYAAC